VQAQEAVMNADNRIRHDQTTFHSASLLPLISVAAALPNRAAAQPAPAARASTRRDVITQRLSSEPARDSTLFEVTYPRTGSPPPHCARRDGSLLRAVMADGVATLERLTVASPRVEGVVSSAQPSLRHDPFACNVDDDADRHRRLWAFWPIRGKERLGTAVYLASV
jgi:hypothetical protein